MCRVNILYGDTRIDPCMRELIFNLKVLLMKGNNLVACCCGHGKYPMTIVIKGFKGVIFDLVSNKEIPRTRRFYKKDSEGYYYIPETIEAKNGR